MEKTENIEEIIARIAHEKDTLALTVLYRSAANYYFEQRDYVNLQKYATLCYEIAEPRGYLAELASAQNYIGICNVQYGQNKVAKEYLLKAYDYFKLNDKAAAIKCLGNIGIVEYRLGNLNESMRIFYDILDMEGIEKDRIMLAKTYSCLGTIYFRLELNEKSREFYTKALSLRKELGKLDLIATTYANMGSLLSDKEANFAISYYKKALRVFLPQNNRKNIAICYNNIASKFRIMKLLPIAERYYEKAIELANMINFEPCIASATCGLGVIKEALGHSEEALELYKSSLALSEEINDIEMQIEVYECLAEHYKNLKNFEKCCDYKDILLQLNKDKFKNSMAEQIANLQSRFDWAQKNKETEIYRLRHEELAQSYSRIEQQKAELEELNTAKDMILNIVSHDLRNALSGIFSAIELIYMNSIDDTTKQYLSIIEIATKKANQLVSDIMDSYHLQMKDYHLDLSVENINNLIKNYEASLRIWGTKKQITFAFKYPHGPVYLQINPKRFWQIMSNLVNNSVKFTHFGGTITIQISTNKENEGIIEIIDTGIGISAEKIPVIFDRFTTASRQGTEGESSTGLGLSIVKKLVELHNGKISVESTVGSGTTFILVFPIYTIKT